MRLRIPNTITVIGFDPGSTKCGVSVMVLDFINKKILTIEAWTIKVEGLVDDTGLDSSLTSKLMIRCQKLKNEVIRLLQWYQPDVVAYEGPFMNQATPNAFGPLFGVMTVVHEAVFTYRIGLPFTVLQPTLIKMSIGVAGKKGKEVVIAALVKVKAVMDALITDVYSLDDNGVDAIAVNYAYFLYHIQESFEPKPPKGKKGKKHAEPEEFD